MSWRAITEADVKSSGLTGPELSAARTIALASGVTDTLADVIARTTEEVRGRVAACANNQLDEDATFIPTECLTAALARIVYELTLRLPGKVLLTEQRDKANDNALRFLRDVAACEVRLVQSETPSEDATIAVDPGHSGYATRIKMRTEAP